MTRYAIGQPVTQVEAPRLLTGQGRFTDDITLPRQAVAVFLRSPHAHADIVRIDTSAAGTMPGVLAVLTCADYDADGIGDVTGASPARRRDGSPMFRPPRPALARGRVRHIGQMVAVVIAETVNQAKDGAENIAVEYAPRPAHLSTADGNRPETPALWEDCPDNEALFAEQGDAAAVDAALADAAHVVRDTFVVNRVAANAMEPRAVVADYDHGRDHYTIHACQQRPYMWRTLMSRHLFDIPENKMTLVAGDVGGSFGMKGGLYPEVAVAAWASKRVGRPVKWTCERSEGQVHGGIGPAAGQALIENIVYEPDSGQLLTGSFMDYAMPRADDICNFDLARHPVPTATNPMGVKGAGECGTVGGLAAVMNAVNDALAPLGVANLAMPATPERVWRAIHQARGP